MEPFVSIIYSVAFQKAFLKIFQIFILLQGYTGYNRTTIVARRLRPKLSLQLLCWMHPLVA